MFFQLLFDFENNNLIKCSLELFDLRLIINPKYFQNVKLPKSILHSSRKLIKGKFIISLLCSITE